MRTGIDVLDQIAVEVAKGDSSRWQTLGTSGRLYVALAANRQELLEGSNYTVAEAIARIGPDWTAELVERWQYRGDPRKFAPGQLTESVAVN